MVFYPKANPASQTIACFDMHLCIALNQAFKIEAIVYSKKRNTSEPPITIFLLVLYYYFLSVPFWGRGDDVPFLSQLRMA